MVNGERIQEMRNISAREYLEQIKDRDLNSVPLVKTRTIFGYNLFHFQLETYTNLPGSPTILKVDTDDKHEQVTFPPFIKIKEDLTNNSAFSSASLAMTKV